MGRRAGVLATTLCTLLFATPSLANEDAESAHLVQSVQTEEEEVPLYVRPATAGCKKKWVDRYHQLPEETVEALNAARWMKIELPDTPFDEDSEPEEAYFLVQTNWKRVKKAHTGNKCVDPEAFAEWALNPNSQNNTYTVLAIELSNGKKRLYSWESTGYPADIALTSREIRLFGVTSEGGKWQSVYDFIKGIFVGTPYQAIEEFPDYLHP